MIAFVTFVDKTDRKLNGSDDSKVEDTQGDIFLTECSWAYSHLYFTWFIRIENYLNI